MKLVIEVSKENVEYLVTKHLATQVPVHEYLTKAIETYIKIDKDSEQMVLVQVMKNSKLARDYEREILKLV